jgi:hypothetical protein
MVSFVCVALRDALLVTRSVVWRARRAHPRHPCVLCAFSRVPLAWAPGARAPPDRAAQCAIRPSAAAAFLLRWLKVDSLLPPSVRLHGLGWAARSPGQPLGPLQLQAAMAHRQLQAGGAANVPAGKHCWPMRPSIIQSTTARQPGSAQAKGASTSALDPRAAPTPVRCLAVDAVPGGLAAAQGAQSRPPRRRAPGHPRGSGGQGRRRGRHAHSNAGTRQQPIAQYAPVRMLNAPYPPARLSCC